MIYLLYIYKRDKESKMMLLHHICTSNLIAFSYIVNYSNIGCIVLFLHNETDLLVHLTRLFIPTNIPEWIKNSSGVALTINFLYMRLFVFEQCIYTIVFDIEWEWGWITTGLCWFLMMLYTLHINWVILLLLKAYGLVMEKSSPILLRKKRNI